MIYVPRGTYKAVKAIKYFRIVNNRFKLRETFIGGIAPPAPLSGAWPGRSGAGKGGAWGVSF